MAETKDLSDKSYQSVYHQEWAKEVVKELYTDCIDKEDGFSKAVDRVMHIIYPEVYQIWSDLTPKLIQPSSSELGLRSVALSDVGFELNFLDWFIKSIRLSIQDLNLPLYGISYAIIYY